MNHHKHKKRELLHYLVPHSNQKLTCQKESISESSQSRYHGTCQHCVRLQNLPFNLSYSSLFVEGPMDSVSLRHPTTRVNSLCVADVNGYARNRGHDCELSRKTAHCTHQLENDQDYSLLKSSLLNDWLSTSTTLRCPSQRYHLSFCKIPPFSWLKIV